MEWCILTHPHHDHFNGLTDLVGFDPIEEASFVEREPKRIGLSFLYSVDDLETWIREAGSLQLRGVLGHLKEACLQRVEPLHAKRELLSCEDRSLVAQVLHPPCDQVQAILRAKEPWKEISQGSDRNRLSVVLSVRYGDTALLLPGDLEGVCKKSGWGRVKTDHPECLEHHMLKVAHHGSTEAQDSDVLESSISTDPRWWAVTPYNGGAGLPTVEGLNRLLRHESPLHLSALPTKLDRQRVPGNWRITPSTYEGLVSDRINAGAVQPFSACDPVWVAAFDDNGKCTGQWRGSVAFEVIRQGGQ